MGDWEKLGDAALQVALNLRGLNAQENCRGAKLIAFGKKTPWQDSAKKSKQLGELVPHY